MSKFCSSPNNETIIKSNSLFNLFLNSLKTLKWIELEERLSKCQADLQAHQLSYQYTVEDVAVRDAKNQQLEYDLEELTNQIEMTKKQNQELLNANTQFKDDFDQLMDQKRKAEREITQLESANSELQMNFTSTHQQLKKEVSTNRTNVCFF